MKRVAIILIALVSFLTHSYSQNLSEQQIKTKINQVAAQMKSMQCDFVQTKHLKMLNDQMVSKGKMFYQQSDKLRWEYTSPYRYTFVINGSKVQLKNNNRNDVIDVNKNKIFKEITRIMMNSVVGKSLLDDKDFISNITSNNTEWIAKLKPVRKDLKQMFKEIYLHFNQKASMVSKVILIEKNGDKTIIELKDIRTNVPINANVFVVK